MSISVARRALVFLLKFTLSYDCVSIYTSYRKIHPQNQSWSTIWVQVPAFLIWVVELMSVYLKFYKGFPKSFVDRSWQAAIAVLSSNIFGIITNSSSNQGFFFFFLDGISNFIRWKAIKTGIKKYIANSICFQVNLNFLEL